MVSPVGPRRDLCPAVPSERGNPAARKYGRTVVRTTLLLAISLTGCISGRIGPGLRPDWSQASRDPDPTRTLVEPTEVNPWGSGEAGQGSPDPQRVKRSPRRDVAERSAATFLGWMAAGWSPLLTFHGEFEEDPVARKKLRRERAAADAKDDAATEAAAEDAAEPADADPR